MEGTGGDGKHWADCFLSRLEGGIRTVVELARRISPRVCRRADKSWSLGCLYGI